MWGLTGSGYPGKASGEQYTQSVYRTGEQGDSLYTVSIQNW